MTSRSSRQNQQKRRRPKTSGRHRQSATTHTGQLIIGMCLLILAGIIFFQIMLSQPKPHPLTLTICAAYFSSGALYIALHQRTYAWGYWGPLATQAVAFLLVFLIAKPTFSLRLWAWLGLTVSLLLYLKYLGATVRQPLRTTYRFWGSMTALAVILGALLLPEFMAPDNTAVTSRASEAQRSSTRSQSTRSQTSTPSKKTKATPKYYFKGNILKRQDLYLEITQKAVIQPGQPGNMQSDHPVLAIWYRFKNTGRDIFNPQDAWIGSINAYQATTDDPYHKLELSALPDDKYAETQNTDLKPNETGAGVIGYVLADQTTPVTLRADVIDENLGSITITF